MARNVLTWALAMLACWTFNLATGQVNTTELRVVQPLMDNWQFVQDDALSDEQALVSAGAGWQTVSLPHTWNAQDAASLNAEDYKRGLGWYRLTFSTPSAGARHWLEFGAASLVADVWLNGEHLGQHKGGFTAFRFDVTERLAAGAPNVLLVKVDNSVPIEKDDPTVIAPMGGDFNKPGGLYRYVSLVSTTDPVHFDLADMGGPGVYATTTSIADNTAVVNVRAKVKSDAAAAGNYSVRVSLLDAAGQLAATVEQAISLAAGAAGEVDQNLSVASPHLWQGVTDPYLYKLVAELVGSNGAPIDKVVQSFGIRQASFDPELGFFLNGQHVRLQGAAMHQDFLGKAWAVSNADIDTSLGFFTEIGANAIRLGHYPFGQYALQRVSELGLIAYAEASLGTGTTVDPKQCSTEAAHEGFVANAQQQLREMIRQQYNHAAIVLWGVGNETSMRQIGCKPAHDNVTPVIRAMHETAKSEDPSRPTAYSEFPHPVKRSGPFATEGITDLFATNRYFLWYHQPFRAFSPLLDSLHELTPDQPLGISEYGAGAALTHHTDNPLGGEAEVHGAPEGEGPSYQPEEFASYAHEQNYAVISGKPYVWGSFLWNMFDFGSANRREGDLLGVNTKGIVTFDRQTRKDPFYFYKANWSTAPVTYIVGRRYTERAYPVADVKVCSNADSVELTVNGASVGALTVAEQCPQRTCLFNDVRLSPGANTVTAIGNHAGSLVRDTVEWSLSSTNFNIASGQLWSGYVATDGARFGSDDFFTGGMSGWLGSGDPPGGDPPEVAGTDDPQLYKYFRHGEFSYDIPLADGSYEVTLGFVEPDARTAVGDRVFSVTANGQPLLENFDVLQQAGADGTAVERTFTVAVSGGRLVLAFTPTQEEAIVSYIRITSATGG